MADFDSSMLDVRYDFIFGVLQHKDVSPITNYETTILKNKEILLKINQYFFDNDLWFYIYGLRGLLDTKSVIMILFKTYHLKCCEVCCEVFDYMIQNNYVLSYKDLNYIVQEYLKGMPFRWIIDIISSEKDMSDSSRDLKEHHPTLNYQAMKNFK